MASAGVIIIRIGGFGLSRGPHCFSHWIDPGDYRPARGFVFKSDKFYGAAVRGVFWYGVFTRTLVIECVGSLSDYFIRRGLGAAGTNELVDIFVETYKNKLKRNDTRI